MIVINIQKHNHGMIIDLVDAHSVRQIENKTNERAEKPEQSNTATLCFHSHYLYIVHIMSIVLSSLF